MHQSNTNKVVAIAQPLAGQLFTGTVESIENNRITLIGAQGPLQAQRAKSCLLDPQPNDLVLFCVVADKTFVTDVLSSSEEVSSSIITLPANTELHCANHLTMKAPKMKSISVSHQVLSGELDVQTKQAKLTSDDTELSTGTLRTMVKRGYQTFEQLFKSVTQAEHHSAGSLLQNIKQLWTAKSQQTVISAKQDVKVDAQRIHMG